MGVVVPINLLVRATIFQLSLDIRDFFLLDRNTCDIGKLTFLLIVEHADMHEFVGNHVLICSEESNAG
jgi:hypothetical protein